MPHCPQLFILICTFGDQSLKAKLLEFDKEWCLNVKIMLTKPAVYIPYLESQLDGRTDEECSAVQEYSYSSNVY